MDIICICILCTPYIIYIYILWIKCIKFHSATKCTVKQVLQKNYITIPQKLQLQTLEKTYKKTAESELISGVVIPVASLGFVYLPTSTIKLNHSYK